MKRLLAVFVILAGGAAIGYAGRGYLAGKGGQAPVAPSAPAPVVTEPPAPIDERRPTLISASPLLRKLRVRVYPAENGGETIQVPEKVVGPGESVFLLGKDDQLHELARAQGGEFTVPWGCGGNLPGAGFNLVEGGREEGRLILIGGPESRSQIHWSSASAREVEKAPESIKYKAGYVINSLFYANTVGLPQSIHIYTASWKSPAHSENPPDDKENCADWTHEQLGIMTAQGQAKILFENEVDCDGQGYRGGTVGNLAGVLEVTSGADSETWLIFEASGYEGAAYLSLKLDLENVERQVAPDFVVYSGC